MIHRASDSLVVMSFIFRSQIQVFLQACSVSSSSVTQLQDMYSNVSWKSVIQPKSVKDAQSRPNMIKKESS